MSLTEPDLCRPRKKQLEKSYQVFRDRDVTLIDEAFVHDIKISLGQTVAISKMQFDSSLNKEGHL